MLHARRTVPHGLVLEKYSCRPFGPSNTLESKGLKIMSANTEEDDDLRKST